MPALDNFILGGAAIGALAAFIGVPRRHSALYGHLVGAALVLWPMVGAIGGFAIGQLLGAR
jgi:hypothetical protein